MIEVKELCAGYRGNEVIHQVDFSARAGEITVLAGPNGCGKSTLLKALAGIIPHTAGQILVAGQDSKALSAGALAQRIAYLPQNKAAPEVTVGRMVLYGRFPYLRYPRRYSAKDYAAAAAAMERIGLTQMAALPLSQLSGGMQQRVYIAMALAQDAPVILMDEPTSYLDVSHQLQLMKLARRLAGDGKAVIMVLHDLPLAMEVADRLVVMERGRIVASGTAEMVYGQGTIDGVFQICLKRMQTPDGWRYYYA